MNDDFSLILFTIAFFIGVGIVIWLIESISNSAKYKKLKPQLDNLEKSIKDHESKVETDNFILDERIRLWNNQIEQDKENIQKIAKQKSMGFPWLAEAYADYFSLKDLQREEYLTNKNHPALKAAEIIREIKNKKYY